VALICEQFHVYEDGYFGADKCYLWVSTVQNTTQLTALYALIWFYLAMKEELAPFSPLLKFTLVKAVVFFTFWQAVALAMGVKMGIITPALGFTAAGESLCSSSSFRSASVLNLCVLYRDSGRLAKLYRMY